MSRRSLNLLRIGVAAAATLPLLLPLARWMRGGDGPDWARAQESLALLAAALTGLIAIAIVGRICLSFLPPGAIGGHRRGDLATTWATSHLLGVLAIAVQLATFELLGLPTVPITLVLTWVPVAAARFATLPGAFVPRNEILPEPPGHLAKLCWLAAAVLVVAPLIPRATRSAPDNTPPPPPPLALGNLPATAKRAPNLATRPRQEGTDDVDDRLELRQEWIRRQQARERALAAQGKSGEGKRGKGKKGAGQGAKADGKGDDAAASETTDPAAEEGVEGEAAEEPAATPEPPRPTHASPHFTRRAVNAWLGSLSVGSLPPGQATRVLGLANLLALVALLGHALATARRTPTSRRLLILTLLATPLLQSQLGAAQHTLALCSLFGSGVALLVPWLRRADRRAATAALLLFAACAWVSPAGLTLSFAGIVALMLTSAPAGRRGLLRTAGLATVLAGAPCLAWAASLNSVGEFGTIRERLLKPSGTLMQSSAEGFASAVARTNAVGILPWLFLALVLLAIPIARATRTLEGTAIAPIHRERRGVLCATVFAALALIAWSSLPLEPARELGEAWIVGSDPRQAAALLLIPALLYAGLLVLPTESHPNARKVSATAPAAAEFVPVGLTAAEDSANPAEAGSSETPTPVE